jgi:hypothetical protein
MFVSIEAIGFGGQFIGVNRRGVGVMLRKPGTMHL